MPRLRRGRGSSAGSASSCSASPGVAARSLDPAPGSARSSAVAPADLAGSGTAGFALAGTNTGNDTPGGGDVDRIAGQEPGGVVGLTVKGAGAGGAAVGAVAPGDGADAVAAGDEV